MLGSGKNCECKCHAMGVFLLFLGLYLPGLGCKAPVCSLQDAHYQRSQFHHSRVKNSWLNKYLHIPGFRDALVWNRRPSRVRRLLFLEPPGKNIGNVEHVVGTDCRPGDAANDISHRVLLTEPLFIPLENVLWRNPNPNHHRQVGFKVHTLSVINEGIISVKRPIKFASTILKQAR